MYHSINLFFLLFLSSILYSILLLYYTLYIKYGGADAPLPQPANHIPKRNLDLTFTSPTCID